MNPGAAVLSRTGAATAADFSNATGAPIVGDTLTGQLYWLGAGGTPFPIGFPNAGGFGADPSYTAAVNTAAFNAALASSNVLYVPGGPSDIYDLNALDPITTGKIIFGYATLRFNTTSDAIDFNISSSPAQSTRFIVKGLRFDNLTNVPSSFIRSRGTSVNGLIDECQFSECAATYCIDNYIGYGLKIRNSVLSDITGSAVRFQDSLNQTDGYSFVASIDGCDITRPSVDGIVIEGSQVLGISNTVVEGCGGKGIVTKALTNTTQAWNIHLDNVYFEGNTGTDLDLSDCDGSYWSVAQLSSCTFAGTPTIALGVKSKITLINCCDGGGSVCTVSGSSNASAILIGCANFTQSGQFNYYDQTGNNGSWCWAGAAAESLPLLINASAGGRTFLFLLSHQTNTANFTASAIYMVRCGYDGNNFTATKVSGDDGGAGAGASNFTFGQSSGVLTVTAAGVGNHIASWSANGTFKTS